MDTSPKVHIERVVWFNTEYKLAYQASEPCPVGHRSTVLFIDVSESMKNLVNELKLSVSFFKALSGMPRLPDLPKPAKRTNLIGAVMDYLGELEAEPSNEDTTLSRVVILTDGLDNEYTRNVIPTGWDENGTVVNTTLPPLHAADYWERRQESVLKALTDYAKVEVCLIGIGEEVKRLLGVAQRLPITVAAIPSKADKKSICSTINAAMRRSSRPRVRTSSSASTSTSYDNSNAAIENPLIDASSVEPEEQPSLQLIEQAQEAADKYTLGTKQDITIGEFKTAYAKVEASAGFPFDVDSATGEQLELLKFTRAGILWLLKESVEKDDPLPGALFSSPQQGIVRGKFEASRASWKSPVNRILSGLRATDKTLATSLLRSVTHDKSCFRCDGFSADFTKVPCYTVADVRGLKQLVLDVYNAAANEDPAQDWAMHKDTFINHTVFGSQQTKIDNSGKRSRSPSPTGSASGAEQQDTKKARAAA